MRERAKTKCPRLDEEVAVVKAGEKERQSKLKLQLIPTRSNIKKQEDPI